MKSLLLLLALGFPLLASAEESLPSATSETRPMTQERMEALLRALAPGAEGVPGSLAFKVEGVQIECISDPPHDRMRLVAAIAPVSKLSSEHVARILEANFHTALDARYATSGGYLYAAFIHPLGSLTEKEIRSAVLQVANLARSFGTTYSSGQLVYGGANPL
jgi:hypothetical protein